MSNSDSFIDEVSQEVRRDRFYGLARRYGWIAILAVVLIVAAAAFVEWRGASREAAARGLGDRMLAAVQAEAPQSRIAALSEVQASGAAEALRAYALAAQLAETDAEAAGDVLLAVIDDAEVPQLYRDLAVIKLVLIPDYGLLSDQKLARLEPLTAPGAPFRLSALEQTAILHAERGEREAALEVLETIASDVAASADRRTRAQELIVALGGLPDAG